MRTLVLLGLLVIPVGCGRDPAPQPIATEPATSGAEGPRVTGISRPTGALSRTNVVAIVDLGLGRFLQGVETEPVVVERRFVGFRLVRLYPDDPRFAALDLRPGDVITRINGQSIERPEQALEMWNGLRIASELAVEYLRDGEAREMRLAIID
jgi:S1-C subfamily serine protease